MSILAHDWLGAFHLYGLRVSQKAHGSLSQNTEWVRCSQVFRDDFLALPGDWGPLSISDLSYRNRSPIALTPSCPHGLENDR